MTQTFAPVRRHLLPLVDEPVEGSTPVQGSRSDRLAEAVGFSPSRDLREIVQTPEFLRGELKHKGTQLWAGGKYLHEYQDPVNKQRIFNITDRADPYFGHGEGYL